MMRTLLILSAGVLFSLDGPGVSFLQLSALVIVAGVLFHKQTKEVKQ